MVAAVAEAEAVAADAEVFAAVAEAEAVAHAVAEAVAEEAVAVAEADAVAEAVGVAEEAEVAAAVAEVVVAAAAAEEADVAVAVAVAVAEEVVRCPSFAVSEPARTCRTPVSSCTSTKIVRPENETRSTGSHLQTARSTPSGVMLSPLSRAMVTAVSRDKLLVVRRAAARGSHG